MRLFTLYNRVLLITSMAGLLIIGYLFYNTLSTYLNKQIDNYLVEELLEVRDYTSKRQDFPPHSEFEDLVIAYHKISRISKKRHFGDTIFFNPKKGVKETGRYLEEDLVMAGQNYSIRIIASKIAHMDQAKSIFLVIILPVLGLLVILWAVNRYMMKRIWVPFNQLLLNLKSFNVNKEQGFEQVSTSIVEFRELNDAIVDISQRVKSDYREIRMFTENASHEMMTPIAVINSKLDMMLQSTELSEEHSRNLVDLYRATAKLTKLNQSLLLLVKIDNNLLLDREQVNLKQMLEEKIQYFQEFTQRKSIVVNANLQEKEVLMSRYLADILLDNLIGNSIRHNYKGGHIQVELSPERLSVTNTSEAGALDETVAFERFYKSPASEGMGLGLTIVKQIVELHGFSISYSYHDDVHVFTVIF
ncbi:sensor histidine kinase [Pedobacter chitinilyticus]|uniref:histidine kinase n=1 Tax=Pedobacter chitinilyticus TaxID=2233776 RepID=A0A3S3PJ31_9SPHI|nr:HAMP domain-containing sensor histidine kinase [Pedobacter chitinilyticus]RWU10910.1 HAMP domain-containing histidine kinase [Pedobacter chitinilyticus]